MKPRLNPAIAKEALHILISEGNKMPWSKIKANYIDTTLARNDVTAENMLMVRVSKLPAHEALPTEYFGIPITYLSLPQSN